MIYHLINASYRDLFRFLYQRRKRPLRVLFVDGGKSYSSSSLSIRKTGYFSLLKGQNKTLKDLILAGYLSEYPFSRVIRQSFFVPKLKGDMLYYAYLSRGWGEDLYVEGIEEFEEKVRALKRRERFVDYWEVEELDIVEDLVVMFKSEFYSLRMLSSLFNSMLKNRKKELVFMLSQSMPELRKYFSYTGHNTEELVFREIQFISPEYELMSRSEFLEELQKVEGKVLICEWDRNSLLQWAVNLSLKNIPFGVPYQYGGEKVYLSTPYHVWGDWDVGFFGASIKAKSVVYSRAFTHVRKVFLASEDLLLWGYLKSVK